LRYATGIDNPDNCGENHIVYEDTNTLYSTDYATTVWYDEIRFYDFKWPGLKLTTSHFTQVVWKNSQTFGCGIAGEVVVCMYCPAGNGKGRGTFKDNVMPLDPRNRDGCVSGATSSGSGSASSGSGSASSGSSSDEYYGSLDKYAKSNLPDKETISESNDYNAAYNI
jgi:hypothetical protein